MIQTNDSLLMKVAADIKEHGFAPMKKVYWALMALLDPAAKDAPDLAHTLAQVTRLIVDNVPQWLGGYLSPYPLGSYAFAAADRGETLEDIAIATICAACDSIQDVVEEATDDELMDKAKYFAAFAIIDKFRNAALCTFNARLSA